MDRLNFYDTDVVKAFVLNILVENKKLEEALESEKKYSNMWFKRCQEERERSGKLQLELESLKGGSDNE